MTKWAHADVLDNGPAEIKANANQQRLISAYTAGASYATVVANTVATAAMTAADYTLSSSGSNRRLTTASGKTATASAAIAGTKDLHLAFVDSATSRVLWVTDETSDIDVAIDDICNLPVVTYTSNQPS